jgi:hypothetical protein
MRNKDRRALRRALNECPDKCSGRTPNRQHPLTGGQRAVISESARKVIENATEDPGVDVAYRCNYCGCVYLRDVHRNRGLGRLDNSIDFEVFEARWVSRDFP